MPLGRGRRGAPQKDVLKLEYGMSVRNRYKPEQMNDLADQWIAGNHEVVLEAVRLHTEELRGRISRCVITKRIPKGRWRPAPTQEILNLRNLGYSLNDIAEHTKLTKRTICRILKKHSVSHTRVLPVREALPLETS